MLIQFGLAGQVTSFRIRAAKLVEDYLGKPGSPMPFGGRSRVLAHLNAWLTRPEVPRALLITAPAGRGKTALLVRWINQCGPDVDVCFVPISIRYDTNRSSVFYQALAHRLAEILGAELQRPTTDLADYYKDRALEFIEQFRERKRLCLLVIDGLDEAAGWQVDGSVLPSAPPPSLRIVVSARQLAGHRGSVDWKAQLGWDQPQAEALDFEVPLLDRDGIADVLRSMGDPLSGLSDTVDVVAELHRLTEGGDPLLLKLYIEDLTKHPGDRTGLRPERLPDLPSGFGAYFKRWFREQRDSWRNSGLTIDEPRLDAVLAILACALGPLSLKDIGRLTDTVMPGGAIVTLNSIAPLQRFIIGDGLESNLALSHPKLADYIRELHFGDSILVDKVKEAYLRFGETTLRELDSGVLSPDAVSRYILTYYIQHLEQVRPVPLPRFRDLASAGWRSAWQHLEGGDRGFSEQLEICFATLLEACRRDRALLQQPRIGVGGVVHIGLFLSSIRASGTNCPLNFLFEMTREGLISPRHALFLSSFQPEDTRLEFIVRLVPTLDQSLLGEVEREARQLRRFQPRAKALIALARRLPTEENKRLLVEVILSAEREIEYAYQSEEVIILAVKAALDTRQPFAPELHERAAKFIKFGTLPPLQPASPADAEVASINSRVALNSIYISLEHPLPRGADISPDLASFKEWAGRYVAREEYERRLNSTIPTLDHVTRHSLIKNTIKHYYMDDEFLYLLMSTANDEEMILLLRETLEERSLSGKFSGEIKTDLIGLLDQMTAVALETSIYETPLREIAPRLPVELYIRLLKLLNSKNSYIGRNFVENTAEKLTTDTRRAAIACIFTSKNYWNDEMIAALASAGGGQLLDEVLDTVVSADGARGAHATLGLVQALLPACDEVRVDVLIRRLTQAYPLDLTEAQMLRACAPRASPGMKQELAAWAMRPDMGADLIRILTPIATAIPPHLLQQTLESACELPDLSERVAIVDELLPALSDVERSRAVRQIYRAALEIHDEPFQVVVLAALGQTSVSPEHIDKTPDWLAMLGRTAVAKHRSLSACLIALLPNVDTAKAKAELLEGLQLVERLNHDERTIVWLVAAMSPHLNQLESRVIIQSALQGAKGEFFEVLLLSSPHLQQAERKRLLATVEDRLSRDELDDQDLSMMGVSSIAPAFPIATARRVNEAMLKKMVAAPEGSDRSLWRTLLFLSQHLTDAERTGVGVSLRNALAGEEKQDVVYALLPYAEGELFERLGFSFMQNLPRLPRQEALGLLALVEGNWGETFNLRPAMAEGRPAASFLTRFGGNSAVGETIDAIAAASRLWP